MKTGQEIRWCLKEPKGSDEKAYAAPDNSKTGPYGGSGKSRDKIDILEWLLWEDKT